MLKVIRRLLQACAVASGLPEVASRKTSPSLLAVVLRHGGRLLHARLLLRLILIRLIVRSVHRCAGAAAHCEMIHFIAMSAWFSKGEALPRAMKTVTVCAPFVVGIVSVVVVAPVVVSVVAPVAAPSVVVVVLIASRRLTTRCWWRR